MENIILVYFFKNLDFYKCNLVWICLVKIVPCNAPLLCLQKSLVDHNLHVQVLLLLHYHIIVLLYSAGSFLIQQGINHNWKSRTFIWHITNEPGIVITMPYYIVIQNYLSDIKLGINIYWLIEYCIFITIIIIPIRAKKTPNSFKTWWGIFFMIYCYIFVH